MKPVAAPGLRCPMFRKDVSKVCHTCAWFTQIEGIHPHTGDRMDKWMCAMSAQVLVTIDAGRQAAASAETTQELRNDLHRERQAQTRLLLSRSLVQTERPLSLQDDRPLALPHGNGKG